MNPAVDSLTDFLPEDRLNHELLVVRPTPDLATDSTLEALFGDAGVPVSERSIPDVDERSAFLFAGEELVATSTLAELEDFVGSVESMIDEGGTDALASIRLPEVVARLNDTPVHFRGSPASSPTVLLMAITRHIEARAWQAGRGRLRVGFQRLSRLDDPVKPHTREVYEQFVRTDIDVHVYGTPDWVPPRSLGTTVHGGYDEDFARNWFVVYRSGDGSGDAAFTAYDLGSDEWRGHWTFDGDRVGQIERYLERNL